MGINKRYKFVIVVGRRFLCRTNLDLPETEYFCWSIEDATTFPETAAFGIADDLQEAFPEIKIYTARKDTPWEQHTKQPLWNGPTMYDDGESWKRNRDEDDDE